MILSGSEIRRRGILTPCLGRQTLAGMSRGLSVAGYDVSAEFDSDGAVAEVLVKPGDFLLASTIEMFDMPEDIVGIVHDKSSWARRGLCVQNTVAEPGWRGHLTLELTNHGPEPLLIRRCVGIAQVIFHLVYAPDGLYDGKYQDQARGPQEAR
jgi:dCTP deaminase